MAPSGAEAGPMRQMRRTGSLGRPRSAFRAPRSALHQVLYCGYRWESETGLYHVRHRYYHPTLGRWLSRDPIAYAYGLDTYEYVRARPLADLDPLGLAGVMPGYGDYLEWRRTGSWPTEPKLRANAYKQLIRSHLEQKLAFDESFRRSMQHLLKDAGYTCKRAMVDIWHAYFDAFNDWRKNRGEFAEGKEHRKLLEDVWGETFPRQNGVRELSELAHFFTGAAWGKTAQVVYELRTRSPDNEDTRRDNASAFLGDDIADLIRDRAECYCQCVARKFAEGKLKWTQLLGNIEVLRHLDRIPRLMQDEGYAGDWPRLRLEWFKEQTRDCEQPAPPQKTQGR